MLGSLDLEIFDCTTRCRRMGDVRYLCHRGLGLLPRLGESMGDTAPIFFWGPYVQGPSCSRHASRPAPATGKYQCLFQRNYDTLTLAIVGREFLLHPSRSMPVVLMFPLKVAEM